MRQKSGPVKESAGKVVKDIRRATRRHFSAEDKIRIVLGLRGKERIVELMAADRWQAAATPSDLGTIGFHLAM
jgi:transposase